MAFYETRFPLDVEAGVTGGPERRTDVVALASGREEVNVRWSGPRRRWNAASGVQTLDDMAALVDFFEMAEGRAHGFRMRDWSDWKSCLPSRTPAATDQPLGTGDGATVAFQLAKTYGKTGFRTWARPIRKPVAGTVLIAVDGTPTASGWSVDPTTGVVTFDAAPADGAEIRAGFEFDCAVKFGTDGPLQVSAQLFDLATGRTLGELPDIPLVEDLTQ